MSEKKKQKNAIPWTVAEDEPPLQTMTWERRYAYVGDEDTPPVPAGAVYRAVAKFIEKQQKKYGRARFDVVNVTGDESYVSIYYRIYPKREF